MQYLIPLLAALCWALSVILLKKSDESVNPLNMNLFKNTIGFVLLVLTCFIIDPPKILEMQPVEFWFLGLSGFFGIGIADVLVLKSLKYLDASFIAILECIFAPLVILFSILFLKETLTVQQVFGVGLVTISILLSNQMKINITDKKNIFIGSAFMISGLTIMALGIVIIKPIVETLPILLSSTIRMGFGVIGSLFVFLLYSKDKNPLKEISIIPNKFTVISACVMSSYVAYFFWLLGYKYNDASVTSVLNATSTIFTVILAVIFLKERLTFTKIAASVIAMTGVVLISV